MIRPKYLTLLLAGLMFLLVWLVYFFFTQVQPDAGSSNEPEQRIIQLLASESWVNMPYVQRSIELYEKETGIAIEVEALPGNSAFSLIRKKFASNVLPDIVMFYGGAQMEVLLPTSHLVPFSQATWTDDLRSYVHPQLSNGFDVYGFPLWEGSVYGIIYNKDIFAEHGIEMPENLEQFIAVCERLLSAGIIPLYMGFKDIWPLYPQFGVSVIAFEYPQMVKRMNRNQLKFTDMPEMLMLAQWYSDLVKNGCLGGDFHTNHWDAQIEALISGRYAMAIGSDTYLYRELEQHWPGAGDHFGLMPFYFGFNEEGNYVRNDLILTYITADRPRTEEAKKFIDLTVKHLNDIYRGMYVEVPFQNVTSHLETPVYKEIRKNANEVMIADAISSLIIGFNPEEMAVPLQEMMLGRATPEEAVVKMEAIRVRNAKNQGTPGF